MKNKHTDRIHRDLQDKLGEHIWEKIKRKNLYCDTCDVSIKDDQELDGEFFIQRYQKAEGYPITRVKCHKHLFEQLEIDYFESLKAHIVNTIRKSAHILRNSEAAVGKDYMADFMCDMADKIMHLTKKKIMDNINEKEKNNEY